MPNAKLASRLTGRVVTPDEGIQTIDGVSYLNFDTVDIRLMTHIIGITYLRRGQVMASETIERVPGSDALTLSGFQGVFVLQEKAR